MNETIVLYSIGCPKCNVLEKKLSAKGIEYSVCSNTDDMKTLGITDVPVLSVGGQLMEFKEAVIWVNEM